MMTNDEKESRLAILEEQIEEAKSRVISLNQRINAEKMAITMAENELLMAKHRKPLTVAEPLIDPNTIGTYELNEEHDDILRGKRDQLPRLEQEIRQLQHEREHLEEHLTLLVAENDEYQAEITSLSDSIRATSSETDRLSSECNYVEKQIAERKNEIRMLERLKADAETAYAQLLDRAEHADTIDGGRLDVEKAIDNLRSEFDLVREQIRQLNEEINQSRNDDDDEARRVRQQRGEFEEAVDWRTEREDLRRELEDLNEEIRQRKAGVSVSEHKTTQKQVSLAKYGPFVMKWRGKTSGEPVPAKTVAQLWTEVEETKKRSEEVIQKAEKEMSEIILRNAKLEEEVTRRRTALERTVTQFYADDNQFKKRIEEKRARAEGEENKLMQQIQETKLKLAQKHLRK